MSSLLYWIIFTIIVGFIIAFLAYIIISIIVDKCLAGPDQPETMYSAGSTNSTDQCGLNKYHFDKHDVEDLTRIEGDFKTISPKVTYVNEVDTAKVEGLLKRTEHKRLELGDSHSDLEEGSSRYSIDDLHSATSVYSIITEEKEEETPTEKKGISQSVDDLEFCDPRAIDVLKEINKIHEEAVNVERELKYFIGGSNDVKYYEINEKFLKLMIALCDVRCESDELRRKKSETLEYIEGCQKKLKDKVK